MEDKQMIKVVDESGKEKEYEVVHYFKLDSNDKKYIVYTDNIEDKDGNLLVYTSEIVDLEDRVELKGITDQDTLNEITKLLTNIIKGE